jgi:APA family basic amino acid/polyamine antiporter
MAPRGGPARRGGPRDAARLGLWSATALVVGHTIAVGVFLTPAELIGALASPGLTLAVWTTCAALVLAGALAFGELASRYPAAGGSYVYLREAWGEPVAFLYGWQCLLVMDPGVTAALAIGAADQLGAAWPAAASHARWVAVGFIWVLALANMGGVRGSARLLGLLTAVKVLALVVVVVAAFGFGEGSWSNLVPFAARRPGAPPVAEALALALVGAFFSFGGFWEASRVAGEVRDPRRTLPRALALGVAIVTVVYLAATGAFLYLVGPGDARTANEFTARAGVAMFGAEGPRLLAVVVLLSVVASLAALLLMAPRLYVAMSRDGVLPRVLAPVEPARDSSRPATALLATLASVYTLAATFQQVVAFFFCTALGFVALATAGLFVLRRRGAPGGNAFRCPGYPVVPASFVALLAVVILFAGITRPAQAIAGLGVVLCGVPAYWWLSARGALGGSAVEDLES